MYTRFGPGDHPARSAAVNFHHFYCILHRGSKMNEVLHEFDVLSLSSLRLLLSPLQLVSAALWGVVQHRAVMHYGLLEDFITAVLDLIPDLLSQSEREQLVLGLRAQVVLEMCRSDDLCCRQNIEPHLSRIDDLIKEQDEGEESSSKIKASVDSFSKIVNALLDDPYERSMFYLETFDSVFGYSFDSALCELVRKFLMNLERQLPVPSLDQASQWLDLSPAVLMECRDVLNHPEPLSKLLQHHKQQYTCSPGPIVTDFIFSSFAGISDIKNKTEQHNGSYAVKVEKTFNVEKTEYDEPSIEITLDESDSDSQEYNGSVSKVDQTNSERNTFKCFVCGQTFSSFSELSKHIIPGCSANTVEKNMSEHLSSRFVISTDVSEGQRRKRSSRIKTCSVCGEAFSSSADLMNHMRAHTESYSQISEEYRKDLDQFENMMSHQINGCERSKEDSKSWNLSQELLQKGMKECVVVIQRMPDDREPSPQISTISCKDCGRRLLKHSFRNHQRKCVFKKHNKQWVPSTTNTGKLIRIKPCKLSLSTTSPDTDSKQIGSSSESQNTYSSKQRLMKCTLCDLTFSKMPRLKSHYRLSHKVKGPFHCPVCQRSFVRLYELVLHHNDIRLCQCSTCKKCFPSEKQLMEHKKLFNDTCATVYICEICGKSCMSASAYKCHKYCHQNFTDTTVCSYCGKKFSSPSCLKLHMNRHTGGFSCPVCAKVFYQKTFLNRHMHKHNGIPQPYLCEICGKDWPTQGYLKVHMVEHSQERPFKCDQCGVAYKRSSALKEHLIKHTNQKSYVCTVCSARFNHSQMLKEHMMKHTGVRPHACFRCGKSFIRKYHLKIHQKKTCTKTKNRHQTSASKHPQVHVTQSTQGSHSGQK